jgi:hypothetical protein
MHWRCELIPPIENGNRRPLEPVRTTFVSLVGICRGFEKVTWNMKWSARSARNGGRRRTRARSSARAQPSTLS